jgi:hypothetical protein
VRRIVAGEALDEIVPPVAPREPSRTAKERPAGSIVSPLPPRPVTQE